MKLLYFAPGAVHTYRFIERFKDEFEVVFACYGEREAPGVGTIRMPFKSRYARWTPFLNISPLRKIIEREKPDLVHAMYILPWGYYASRATSGRTKLVISAWGDDVYHFSGRFHIMGSWFYRTNAPERWHRRTASHFDAGVVECEHVRKRMGVLGYDTKKVHVIPWGPDCSVFAPEKRDEKLRGEIAPGKEIIVGCTRYLQPEYGVERLVRAMKGLDKRIGLVLIGSGEDMHKLKRLSIELGIEKDVRFLGEVAHKDIARYVASFDILVSPSLSDTISISLLEGMACSLAVASSDVGGTSEWIENEKNGILLKENSPEEISRLIDRLASDEKMRKTLGEKARDTVLERGDWRRTSEIISRFYRQL